MQCNVYWKSQRLRGSSAESRGVSGESYGHMTDWEYKARMLAILAGRLSSRSSFNPSRWRHLDLSLVGSILI
jgi:hypothetical protein